jgi:C4-dicarboxylate transporter
MYNLLSNNAFWTIIGIILGSAINHVFWLFQLKKQEKLQNRSDRQKKIDEICDFLNLLDEKLKIIYGVCVTGEAVNYFSEIQNFWAGVPTLKVRMNIQIFFVKCLKEYDDLQISISNFIEIMHKIMGNEIISKNEFNKKYSDISIKRDGFINALIKEYSNSISILGK